MLLSAVLTQCRAKFPKQGRNPALGLRWSQGAQADLLFPAHCVVVLGPTSCPALKGSAKAAVMSRLGMEGFAVALGMVLALPDTLSWFERQVSARESRALPCNRL